MSTRKPPYTVVEIVQEMPPGKTPEEGRFVQIQDFIVNGQPVTVAQDGMHIACDPNEPTKITLELLVDEFHIHRVPHGYTDGKTSTSTGPHLRFKADRYPTIEELQAPLKNLPPRDHLGRFTKRKSHYSDYLTDD